MYNWYMIANICCLDCNSSEVKEVYPPTNTWQCHECGGIFKLEEREVYHQEFGKFGPAWVQ